MLAHGHTTEASAKGGSADARSPQAWMQIRGLTKSFAGELALHEADLDISKGEIHGLVGANGAGKSTLIRCLAGVTLADSGRITIDGQDLRQGSPQASEQAAWRSQGYPLRADRLEGFEFASAHRRRAHRRALSSRNTGLRPLRRR